MNDHPETVTSPDLWQAYLDLPPHLRLIMRVQAMSFPSFDHYRVGTALAKSNLPGPKGKRWAYGSVYSAIETLIRKKLMVNRTAYLPPLLHPVSLDAFASPEAEAILAVVEEAYPSNRAVAEFGQDRSLSDYSGLLRLIRFAIYTNQGERFAALCAYHDRRCSPTRSTEVLTTLYATTPLGLEWLASRHPEIQIALFKAKLESLLGLDILPAPPDLETLRTHFRSVQDEPGFASLLPCLLDDALMAGEVNQVQTLLTKSRLASPNNPPSVETLCMMAAAQFLTGQGEAARQTYRAALKSLRKRIGRRKIMLPGLHGMLFPLSLLEANDAALHPEIATYLESNQAPLPGSTSVSQSVQVLLLLSQGSETKAAGLLKPTTRNNALGLALAALAEYAFDPARSRQRRDQLIAEFNDLKIRLPLLARIHAEILAEILAENGSDPASYRAYLAAGGADFTLRFTRIISIQEPWQRALDSLGALLEPANAPTAASPARDRPAKRLAWFVDPDSKAIEVVEQTAQKAGWSDGRPIALKRLHERDARLSYLSTEDLAALSGLRREIASWDEAGNYWFDPNRTLPALVGHPALFDARHRSRPIELVAYPLELVISAQGPDFHVALSHIADDFMVFLEPETPSRYRVIEFPKRLLPIQEVLGVRGLTVPANARDQIIALVRKTNPTLPIRAELAEFEQQAEEGIIAPVVQIIPDNEALKLNLVVRPFGAEGPAYVAGLGGRSVLATIAGEQRRATRDLQGEITARAGLIAACPTLRDRSAADMHELTIDDPEGALECLLELQACTEPLSIEWPEGQRIKVHPTSSAGMKVKISQDRNWFNVDGTIALDDDRVLEMRYLLDRLSRAQGRFVKLDDGSFVALTHQLQTQLQKLSTVSETHRSGQRVHALAAASLDAALAEGGTITADAAWKRQIKQITAAERWTPTLPARLEAELRDYQIEGFVWLSRLARWGAGACLADDMGLGKTIQAIAVLLDRAADGPCLVVAPTSVCPNWSSELRRFAPTLTVHRLSATTDRAGLIAGLGANNVLICSYGLLHQESEALSGVTWSMVVLDEAQAIKNADTKRAQASLSLRAAFRLVLTGTPVENYLDELWSLFNFLNPGLLGSREGFQKRYAIPIERDRDPQARQALRTLLRPFLLRRTKSAVLSELPPRTEQTIVVEMNEAERAFYEALRQQALDSLAALDDQAGKRKIHILAAITKLRRACCNPALITPEAAAPSGKLDTFLALVEELIRNRHRALVFSQFVGHLALIRAALDQRGISYQYLDGSTPAADRERRVAAFQAGQSDLFLISLRAGGTGLNLTAADYVVHLDPWWNPAVEDQASDRAHRIGQERPVTIYRLIMENSIEERILALHRDKRDLASELLEGGEVAARLTEDELIDLIRV